MPVKNELKIEGNIVYWFNGEKWLIKETCADEAKAQELLTMLNAR